MKNVTCYILALSSLYFCASSLAHGRFILPSHTLLSTQKPESISLLASISNDVFHPDMPLGDNGEGWPPQDLAIMFRQLQSILVNPAGTVMPGPSWQSFARFSAADQLLETDGTYRISLEQPATTMITFNNPDGSPNRVFGPDTKLPLGASNIVKRITSSKVVTFITKNDLTQSALKPSKHGLTLTGTSHPNDLFVAEPVNFQLMFDGAALTEKTTVTLSQSGTRHRNLRQELKLETDEQGHFSTQFEHAGFYLLQAEFSHPGQYGSGVDRHHYSLYVTLEVFPQ